ncbi:MAG TPA: 4-hydroxythreonine-4-phosphate dehydrogenase PdxA [Pirellulales bacterium]|nr:4-hydroxythreonine-4-phosphate dehydrogenase PdxA [Pirellulales bacterium]
MDDRPLLAITMGDPAGIGPETIARAWADPAMHEVCRAVVVGNSVVLRRAVKVVGSRAEVVAVEEESLTRGTASEPRRGTAWDADGSSIARIPCLECGDGEAEFVSPAMIDPRGGQAAYDSLVKAVELTNSGRVDGIVTAPLHKAALWQAGHHYPGHTELLAELCGVRDFAMMLYLPPGETVRGPAGLGVVHVTLHMALRDVFASLDCAAILSKIHLADEALRRLRRFHGLGDRPRIAVAALNPHAGEEGLFGDEERTVIGPAVERARAEGLDVVGPLPTDTLMAAARDGRYDAVVAMYHDQGHIAIKLLGMHSAVNVTLGLPIVRTSVAHGTAFDLAWQGRAECSGMIAALRVAAQLKMTNDEIRVSKG